MNSKLHVRNWYIINIVMNFSFLLLFVWYGTTVTMKMNLLALKSAAWATDSQLKIFNQNIFRSGENKLMLILSWMIKCQTKDTMGQDGMGSDYGYLISFQLWDRSGAWWLGGIFFVPNKSVLSLMRQKMREKGEAQLWVELSRSWVGLGMVSTCHSSPLCLVFNFALVADWQLPQSYLTLISSLVVECWMDGFQ